jgi:quinol monooxygenase YgiN
MSDSEITSPFSVLIEYQVRTENNSVAEWLDVWNDRGEDARVGEPETDAYVAAVNLADESNVLVFERYANGQSSLDAHVDRPAHAQLMEAMGSRQMTRRRVMSTGFSDLADYGWWARSGSLDPGDRGVVLMALGFRFGSDEDRATYIKASREHAAYCWDAEPDTLIYSAGLAMADADREIDLHKGEVVFVMACTDLAAANRHANDPRHLALMAELEANIQMERTFLRSYKTTGHGFLWRD